MILAGFARKKQKKIGGVEKSAAREKLGGHGSSNVGGASVAKMFKSPSNTGLVQGIDGTFRAASCKDLANVVLNLFGDKNPVAVLSLGSGSLGVESFFALGGLQVFGLEHDPLKVLTGAMNVLIAEDRSVLTGGSLVLEMGDLKDLRMSSILYA